MPKAWAFVLILGVLAACSAGPSARSQEAQSKELSIGPIADAIAGAREALEDGDFAAATTYLDTATTLHPDEPAAWVEIARLRFRNGEQIAAVDAANEAVSQGPEYAPALLLKAQFVRDAYGTAPSLSWFEAAVEADPDNLEALAEYAATLGDAGYYASMLEVTRALDDLAPKHPKAYYLKAVLAARGENPVLAKSLLERSGLVAQGIPSARLLDAVVDLQEGNFDSAAQTLEGLAQEQPSNARVSDLLARSLWLSGRDAQLIERFAEAARHESASPYLAMLVGRALERQGERQAAADYLERAYSGRPSGWVAMPATGALPEPTFRVRELIGAQRFRQAGRELERIGRTFPKSSDIAALSADLKLAHGDFEGAVQGYREAGRVRGPWPMTRKLAAAHRDLGAPDAAEARLALHLRGEPHNTEALLIAAERAARNADWLRAAVLLDNAIGLGAGNDPRLLKLRSIAARELGDEAGARRFERLTWELHPAILPQG